MKTYKPMTSRQFACKRLEIRNKIDAFTFKVNKEKYTPLVRKFIADNCLQTIGRVYELEGKKKRGFTRFVVYDIKVTVPFSELVMIHLLGWWLDDDSVPAQWDIRVVYGVGNPSKFSLSKNQKQQRVPKHLEGGAIWKG